jgi:hypothetical protein
MFEDNNLPAQGGANNFIDPAGSGDDDSYASAKRKKITLWTIVGVLIIASIALIWWLFVYLSNNKPQAEGPVKNDEPEQVEQIGLGVYLNPTQDIDYPDDGLDDLEGVEYLAFSDFYRLNSYESKEFNFENYTLPINIKVDVSNYYDLSRKIDLDKQLDNLNQFGFAIIDNPWPSQAGDFYSLASSLDERQIPLYISADFVSYYYQNILKTAFKDIEEGVFYQSLWDISRSLYESSRIRYESRLTEIGNVNDRVLEGERLATAFFAVALELLKPSPDQIEAGNKYASGLYNDQEQKKFSFTVPSYLTDDVLRELTLIRASRARQKSPVLLYDRDYKDFVVPTEYRNNARLNNFYLAAAWLNSVFPLNYRSADCPDCLLDKDDWRINFIAASLIAQDFSDNQELRNEWARVYKSLAFFKGLRDAWNYVDYRDGFYDLFGEKGNIADLFAENNLEAEDNFERFRAYLLGRQLLPVQGSYALNSVDGRRFAGLQFLADFYWPNDFILSNLRYPYVGMYEGSGRPASNNITACSVQNRSQRCQGSAHDVLSLIYPDWSSEYYLENSNYSAYPEALSALRPLAEEAMSSNINNYWSSLFLWNNYLISAESNLPLFLQSGPWYEQMAKGALAAWVDMQLPMDKLSLRTQVDDSGTLSAGVAVLDYAWVEPNLEFFDRLIAHNEMIVGMFQAININKRSNLAFNHLRNAHRELSTLRDIAIKQANGEVLSQGDTQAIRDFAKMYSVDQIGEKSLVWHNDILEVRVRQFIEAPKLIVVAHPVDGKIVMAVGPIFNHRESK